MIALKLSLKELKNNKKYWLFFSFNLCIGLIGFTFIYLLRSNVTGTLEKRAKTLLTADLAVSARRVLTAQEMQTLQKSLGDNVLKETKLQELYSMGKVDDKSRLMLIKAIEKSYPLLGSIQLEKNGVLNNSIINKIQTNAYVILSQEIAYQFSLNIGEKIQIGDQSFEVFDYIKEDSTSGLRGINLAPKVYIGNKNLDKTKLVTTGTLAFHSYYFLLETDSNIPKIKDNLQNTIVDPAVNIQTAENSGDQLGRVVNYVTNYLGLIGVVALLLSCIGSSYLFQTYLFDRIKQIGIMRSIGVLKRDIVASFVLIISFLGGLATAVALFVCYLILPIVLGNFSEYLNFDIDIAIEWKMVIILFSLGVFVNLLVCLPIILRVFKSNVSQLLTGQIIEKLSFTDRLHYLPGVVFIWLISVWQANSFIVGTLFFSSMLAVSLFVLLILPRILKIISNILSAHRLSWPVSLSLGYGARVVSRNNTTTLLTILCLCVGTCLINVIGQLDHSLKQELGGDTSAKPSLFLFDIQEDQAEDLREFTQSEEIPLVNLSPMVRARLIKKNDKPIKRMTKDEGFETNESKRKRRFNNRGVNLTFSEGVNATETIVEGHEFSNEPRKDGIAQISLEKRYADRLDVELGDTLTYEILGVEMQGRVVNIRTVKWTSFVPNFFIKFEPGFLEEAPKTYLAAIGHVDFERQLEIQNRIIEKFSNISIINVTDLISKMINLFSIMAIAVGIMSLCCIAVGIFVLYSILQSQMHKKSNEFALQKIVGMGRGQIFRVLLAEYSILVLTSIIIGLFFGIIVSKVVSEIFLDGNFSLDYGFMLSFSIGLLFISILVISATFKLYYKKKINQLLD